MDLTTKIYSIESVIASTLSGYAPNTQENYLRAISLWLGFLKKQGNLEVMTWNVLSKADVHIAKGFIQKMHSEGIAWSTIAVYISGLRRFYNEIRETGFQGFPNLFDSSAITLPRGARMAQKQAPALTRDQVVRLLESASRIGPNAARDTAIMSLLFGAGIRRCELMGIRYCDLTYLEGEYKIYLRKTKGKPFRNIKVPEWVAQALKLYMDTPRKKSLMFDTPVFDFTKHTIFNILRKHGEAIGVDFSSHSGRATVATTLWNNGVPPTAIQAHLGHSSIRTTEGYVRHLEANDPGIVNLNYRKE